MSKRRIRPSTSVKQILVRDFNWRMGNLRRLWCNLDTLTEYRRDAAKLLVEDQQAQERNAHEHRLWCIGPGIDTALAHETMTEDSVLSEAIREAQHNELAVGTVRKGRFAHQIPS